MNRPRACSRQVESTQMAPRASRRGRGALAHYRAHPDQATQPEPQLQLQQGAQPPRALTLGFLSCCVRVGRAM